MAKEDQTTVGLNKPTMAMIVLILSVLAASAFWKDRGGSEAKAEAVHNSIVSSLIETDSRHDKALTAVREEVDEVKERQTSIEKTQISLQKDQTAILTGQQEMKAQRVEDNKLLRDQRSEDNSLLRDQRSEDMKFRAEQQKVISDLNAYLRTIETIE